MCDFEARGETGEEVKKAMFDHAAKDHPEKLASMSEEEKVKINEMMDTMLA